MLLDGLSGNHTDSPSPFTIATASASGGMAAVWVGAFCPLSLPALGCTGAKWSIRSLDRRVGITFKPGFEPDLPLSSAMLRIGCAPIIYGVSHPDDSSSNTQNTPPGSGRLLALDVGSRRIGLAVSDALGITAQPLDTLTRTTKRADLAQIRKLVREHQVTELVLGNPLHMSGEAGTQAGKVAAFANELREHLSLPVHLWDERLTSAEAHRILDDSGHSKDRMHRKGKVDRIAATLILQAFLQSRSTRSVTLSGGREP